MRITCLDHVFIGLLKFFVEVEIVRDELHDEDIDVLLESLLSHYG